MSQDSPPPGLLSKEELETNVITHNYYALKRVTKQLHTLLDTLNSNILLNDNFALMLQSQEAVRRINILSPFLAGLRQLRSTESFVNAVNFSLCLNDISSRYESLDMAVGHPTISDPDLRLLLQQRHTSVYAGKHGTYIRERMSILGQLFLRDVVYKMLSKRYTELTRETIFELIENLILTESNIITYLSGSVVDNTNVYSSGNAAAAAGGGSSNSVNVYGLEVEDSLYPAKLFFQYLGGLVSENWDFGVEAIAAWLETLLGPLIRDMTPALDRSAMNLDNPKRMLLDLLRTHYPQEELLFVERVTEPSSLHRIEVRVGWGKLGQGCDPDRQVAEEKAAKDAFFNLSADIEKNGADRSKSLKESSFAESVAGMSPSVGDNDGDVSGHSTSKRETTTDTYPTYVIENGELVSKTNKSYTSGDLSLQRRRSSNASSSNSAVAVREASRIKPTPDLELVDEEYIDKLTHSTIAQADKNPVWKQRLHAFLGKMQEIPKYETERITASLFVSRCVVDRTSTLIGEGSGTSKQKAEQMAAANALRALKNKQVVIPPRKPID